MDIPDFEAGAILLIDKPLTWTSFDVVNKLRGLMKVKKVGHAGTLDPLATGLLILCTGKYTKKIEEIQNQRKVYTGQFKLGQTTPSFDNETEPDAHFDMQGLTLELLEKTAKQFIGEQMQHPPLFSAVRINGKRAYELARKGVDTEVPAKPVTIYDFKITNVQLPLVDFEVEVSKGTYIRSLARDFGKALNGGAYLNELTRTRIGSYYLQEALSMDDAIELAKAYRVQKTMSTTQPDLS